MRRFAGQVQFTFIELDGYVCACDSHVAFPVSTFEIKLDLLAPDLNMVWMLPLGNQNIKKKNQPEYFYGFFCIHYLPCLSQGSIQQLW